MMKKRPSINKNIFIMLIATLMLISMVYAFDFFPFGDINLMGLYGVKNASFIDTRNITVWDNATVNDTFSANMYKTSNDGLRFNYINTANFILINVSSDANGLGITSDNLNLSLVIFQKSNSPLASARVIMVTDLENSDDTGNELFSIAKAHVGGGSYFTRSLIVGGFNATCNVMTDDVDCDTSATGSDLIVEDEVWIGDSLWINQSTIYNGTGISWTLEELNDTGTNETAWIGNVTEVNCASNNYSIGHFPNGTVECADLPLDVANLNTASIELQTNITGVNQSLNIIGLIGEHKNTTGIWLHNDSDTIFFNETRLNTTIGDRLINFHDQDLNTTSDVTFDNISVRQNLSADNITVFDTITVDNDINLSEGMLTGQGGITLGTYAFAAFVDNFITGLTVINGNNNINGNVSVVTTAGSTRVKFDREIGGMIVEASLDSGGRVAKYFTPALFSNGNYDAALLGTYKTFNLTSNADQLFINNILRTYANSNGWFWVQSGVNTTEVLADEVISNAGNFTDLEVNDANFTGDVNITSGVHKGGEFIAPAAGNTLACSTQCNNFDGMVSGYDYVCIDAVTLAGAASDCSATGGTRVCYCRSI